MRGSQFCVIDVLSVKIYFVSIVTVSCMMLYTTSRVVFNPLLNVCLLCTSRKVNIVII